MSIFPSIFHGVSPMPDEESQALRDNVLSLYSLGTDSDVVISEIYHPRCKFSDPLLTASGHKEIKAQFRSLRGILRKCDAELLSSQFNQKTRNLTIDCNMVFKPRLWFFSAYRIRYFIVVHVGPDGRVRTHEDHWSISSLLEAQVGWLYDPLRRVIGFSTSLLIDWITSYWRGTPQIEDTAAETQRETVPEATAVNGDSALKKD